MAKHNSPPPHRAKFFRLVCSGLLVWFGAQFFTRLFILGLPIIITGAFLFLQALKHYIEDSRRGQNPVFLKARFEDQCREAVLDVAGKWHVYGWHSDPDVCMYFLVFGARLFLEERPGIHDQFKQHIDEWRSNGVVLDTSKSEPSGSRFSPAVSAALGPILSPSMDLHRQVVMAAKAANRATLPWWKRRTIPYQLWGTQLQSVEKALAVGMLGYMEATFQQSAEERLLGARKKWSHWS